MKKFLALIIITATMLCACSVQRYSDADMFCELFNSRYQSKLLEVENAVVTEENGCRQYNFRVGGDTLISLCTDSEKVRIKRVCVTLMGKAEDITGEKFEHFLSLISCATFAFSGKEDSFEELSMLLGIPSASEYSTAITQYAESRTMRYTYSADIAGVCFFIENKSLCIESETALTLRGE